MSVKCPWKHGTLWLSCREQEAMGIHCKRALTPCFVCSLGWCLVAARRTKASFKGPAGTQSRIQPWPSILQPKCETYVKPTRYMKPIVQCHIPDLSQTQAYKQGPFCYFVPIPVTSIQCFTKEVWT